MRKFLAFLCFLSAAFFLFPLCLGVCHAGMFAPALALLLLAAWLLFGKKWPAWLRKTLTAVYLFGAVVAGILLWQMEVHADNVPVEENGDCTVIVLGCRAYNGKPSVMLKGRICAAYAYLSAHPDSVCICSGGLDDRKEPMTQGEVIAAELTAMGIAPENLLVDSKSENTRENLQFSADLIREQGLSPCVAIASDRFHECRAASYARDYGLTPFALGCPSPWFLAPGYYCREMMAMVADLLIR